ncbi:MAG TPA: acyl-CoA thioesterase, partial [Actinobacteria bacterium]|nr:acyl-CoA thioesterase [Actinomycetota bacterium]
MFNQGNTWSLLSSTRCYAPTGVPAVACPFMARTTTIKVRFYELDPYSHVNHTAYFGYFETARIEALEAVGLAMDQMSAAGIHVVVVEMNARFVRPAVSGDTLRIESEVVERGRASSKWQQRMFRDDTLIATLEIRA